MRAGAGGTPNANTAGASGATEVADEFPLDWALHQSCEPSTEADTCKRCEAENCCESYDRQLNTTTRDLARCASSCTKAGGEFYDCWSRCDAQHPGGLEPFATNFACQQQNCSAAKYGCNAEPDSECDTCLHDHCGSEYLGMLGSHAGFLWFFCNGECTPNDGTCYDNCVDKYPDAYPALKRMGECMASQCPRCPSQL